MAYTIPSLSDLAQKSWAAIRTYLPGSDAMPKQNNLVVIAKAWALLQYDVHQRIAWTFRQIFARTADEDVLEKIHGYEENVQRKAASRAAGSITTTGEAGAVYDAGLRWLIGSTGYVTTSSATADGAGAVTMSVRAEATGAAGNQSAGTSLTLADPSEALTLSTTATVGTDGLTGGADREDVETYRARILDRKRRPPQGGAYSDYEQWAMEVPGCTAAWAARTVNSPGSVTVWVIVGTEDGIPTADEVSAVQAYLDDLRRIATDVIVTAPVAVPVDITITGLTPDTASVRDAVADALAGLFRPDADGTYPRGKMRVGLPDGDFTLSRSWISEAISQATGESRHQLTAPAADPTFPAGHYPILGTVSYAS